MPRPIDGAPHAPETPRVERADKVALIVPGWPPEDYANGIVSYVANLIEGLSEYGVEGRPLPFARVDSGSGAGPIHGAFARRGGLSKLAMGGMWKVLPAERSIRLASLLDLATALRSLHREFPYQIIEMEESFGLGHRLEGFLPSPLVIRLHGPWFLNGKALGVAEDAAFASRVALERETIRKAAGVSAPSRDVLEAVRRHYDLELPDAVVIPNSGPLPIDEDVRGEEGSERDLILYVGRFDRHKGGDVMLRAFAELSARRPSARLLFAGPDRGLLDEAGRHWSFTEYLDAHVPALGRGSIEMLGQVSPLQLRGLRRRASVVVCASRYENFPVALLEAFAQGCPVVSSDAGGCPEIATHEATALLFESGNAASLARAVERLLDDGELRQRLGQAALADYRARFLPSQVARRTLDFYAEVLATRSFKSSPGRRAASRA